MLIAAKEKTVRRVVTTHLPTKWGVFQTIGFERDILPGSGPRETAVAIILGNLADETPLVRIHSECFTGEVLGSQRCDCNDQLDLAMRAIAGEGRGLVIYEHQEGRGIGLMAKLRAYALQDEGLDTVEANHALGFKDDARDFDLSVAILRELRLDRVRLLTNNPNKVRALRDGGIDAEQLSCEAAPNSHSLAYLRTKKEKMGHQLRLNGTRAVDRFQPVGSIDQNEFSFASVEDAIREFKAGRMIVVVDDEDRENEGDLTMAAEMITPETINFMATHGRGLICLAMTGERLDKLELHPMSTDNSALGGTAFTVSIDVIGDDVATGISAHDRAETIKAAIDPLTLPEDFGRPGHIFPLRACPGGVLERRGQTEAAVDLASLAGMYPAGVICEIVNDEGTMARVPDLIRFCRKHGLVMVTVADLARYRLDLDFEVSSAAIDGLLPISPTYPALAATRFEPADLSLTGKAHQ